MGRDNPGSLNDLHGHLERMGLEDREIRRIMSNPKEVKRYFNELRGGHGGNFLGYLYRMGFGSYAAWRIANWLFEHHNSGNSFVPTIFSFFGVGRGP